MGENIEIPDLSWTGFYPELFIKEILTYDSRSGRITYETLREWVRKKEKRINLEWSFRSGSKRRRLETVVEPGHGSYDSSMVSDIT